MISSFPKIFQVGSPYIKELFNGRVEVTEKIDGSQFSFGKVAGELFIRSKGKQLFPDAPEKMFKLGIDYVVSIQKDIPDDIVIYGEFLSKPKHNTLVYDKVPMNNIIVFGATFNGDFLMGYERFASALGLGVVPILFEGIIKDAEELKAFLETESILGGTKIEGVVVKNYDKPFLLGDVPIPLMMGKYVSEEFKEKHNSWGRENTGKGRWETYKEDFRTEARWTKAVEHLRDSGELTQEPKDIGRLVQEIHRDIKEEEMENIKNFLWKEFGKDLLRKSTAGFPEWYKEQLLQDNFK